MGHSELLIDLPLHRPNLSLSLSRAPPFPSFPLFQPPLVTTMTPSGAKIGLDKFPSPDLRQCVTRRVFSFLSTAYDTTYSDL